MRAALIATLVAGVLGDGHSGGSHQSQYGGGGGQTAYSSYASGAQDAFNQLGETIPGTPGEDYPILAEVPQTSFLCDGQVEGGYYADPEAECQAFHICGGGLQGSLIQYSFLCPNGSLFNQEYFVCDWWFNVDCSQAEGFYFLNDEIAAEREANSPSDAGYSSPSGGTGYASGASQRVSSSPSRSSYSRPKPSASRLNAQYSSPSSGGYTAPEADTGYAAPGGGYSSASSEDEYQAPDGDYTSPSSGDYASPQGSYAGVQPSVRRGRGRGGRVRQG